MSEPIREALEKAAGAVLQNLSDRKGIGNELEQCDDETKAEIGRTVAAEAIAAFITALHKDGITTIADGNLPWMGDYVLSIAKKDREP
jgi:hypothetical protein